MQETTAYIRNVFLVIYEALLTNRRFPATYQAREGEEPKIYPISPLGIVFKDSMIYLVGSAKDYDNVAQ